jgi:phage terminase large subunit
LLDLLNPSNKGRHRVAYSGRGAAKSWSFARALILRCLQASIRVLCTREYQGSIAESVHKLLSTQIVELGLDQWFVVQRDSITAFTGAEFIFSGLRE